MAQPFFELELDCRDRRRCGGPAFTCTLRSSCNTWSPLSSLRCCPATPAPPTTEDNASDLCCIISSLVQVMMDPHCRTIFGFQSLVQKEWIMGGHCFLDRCNHLRQSDKEEVSVLGADLGRSGTRSPVSALIPAQHTP